MITIRYPSGRIEKREFAVISGQNPIGTARPIPDGATLELMDGWISVTAGKGEERSVLIWARDKITELHLGPLSVETVVLREE